MLLSHLVNKLYSECVKSSHDLSFLMNDAVNINKVLALFRALYYNSFVFVAAENNNFKIIKFMKEKVYSNLNLNELGLYKPNYIDKCNEEENTIFNDDDIYVFREKTLVHPIWIAAKNGNLDLVSYLIENANYSNKLGVSALHIACTLSGNYSVCEKLIYEGKANVNARDNKGFIPLDYVVTFSKDIQLLKLLLDNNSKCGFAIKIAMESCDNKILDFLMKHCQQKFTRDIFLIMGVNDINNFVADDCNDYKKLKLIVNSSWGKILTHHHHHHKKQRMNYDIFPEEFRNVDEIKTIEEYILQSVVICQRIFGYHHYRTKIQLYILTNFYLCIKNEKQILPVIEHFLDLKINYKQLKLYIVVAKVLIYFSYDTRPAQLGLFNCIKIISNKLLNNERKIWLKKSYYHDSLVRLLFKLIFELLDGIKFDPRHHYYKNVQEFIIENILKRNLLTIFRGNTFLHLAVLNKLHIYQLSISNKKLPSNVMVKFLLECGFPVNVQNDLGYTPLDIALNQKPPTDAIINLLKKQPNKHIAVNKTLGTTNYNPQNDDIYERYIEINEENNG